MFGLVDCNNFYASCERVFKPSVNDQPVVVLSNNDGCVIARSQEAKDLGIKMGAPAFMLEGLIKEHGVQVFSSNYVLYGDLSARVMNTLAVVFPQVEVYSIDEAFVDLRGMEVEAIEDLCRTARSLVRQWTGITVSIGVAPSKTLAKVANKLAKLEKWRDGVYVLQDDGERLAALKRFRLEISGVSEDNLCPKIECYSGLQTAYDVSQLQLGWVQKNMTIQGVRLVKELNGIPYREMEERTTKEAIATTRSFSGMLAHYEDIAAAITAHAHSCAAKLRAQGSVATLISVFILTNRFRQELPQYNPSITIKTGVGISNSPELIQYALKGLRAIYKKGYQYKKAGVIVTGLVPESSIQLSLFDTGNREKLDKVSQAMDKVTLRFGKGMLRFGKEGYDKRWKLKSEQLSPCYTTRFNEIVRVKC